jgi:hypothetical protein
MFPEWRVSPFLESAPGIVYVEPRATSCCRRSHRPDGYRGRGRPRLSHPALLRARRLSLAHGFTSRDDNQELEEWKVLIACFF